MVALLQLQCLTKCASHADLHIIFIIGIVKKIVNIAAKGVKAENVLPIESTAGASRSNAPQHPKINEFEDETYESYIKEFRDGAENSYFDVPSSALPSPDF